MNSLMAYGMSCFINYFSIQKLSDANCGHIYSVWLLSLTFLSKIFAVASDEIGIWEDP